MIGSTILHYQILEKLGAGGMGVVYKARDTHLDRFVAIKVLPSGKVSDPDRKRRFVQEAKAASALNHPNIITVHDIATADGLDFIVMEYVEGKGLDLLIGRKGLKIGEALGYAAQVADGLAKAHAAGIVHRDLKPSNIMVRDDGVVKLLDFGLAKLTDSLSADEFASTQAVSRADEPHTEDGTIIGTVAYMSPEQAEGKKVDQRSDIFSFGSVLYEMITGRQAFRRESKLATLAAIKAEDPASGGEMLAALPPQVEELLTRCLRKDPQRRWQSASDLKVVLLDLKEESESGKLRSPVSLPVRKRSSVLPLAAAGLLVVVGAFLVWLFLYRQAPQAEIRINRLTFDAGMSTAPAISRDGKLAAFASDRGDKGNYDIWVQQIPGGRPVQLTRNPANDTSPAFSPDGDQVVFRSQRDGGGLYVVDTLGGEIQGSEARRLADRGYLPRFSPDGEFVSYVDLPASLDPGLNKMYLVSRQGGEPKPFQQDFSVNGATGGSGPVWSPDGKHLLFSGTRNRDPGTTDWWVAPVGDGPAIRTNAKRDLSLALMGSWNYPCAWSGDFVYYISGTTVDGINIFRARISPDSFQVAGRPERLTSGTGIQMSAGVAQDGSMVFASMNFSMNIWSLRANTDSGTTSGGPEKITQDMTAKWSPFVSRDGSRLAFVSFAGLRASGLQIRILEMTGGHETSVTGKTGSASELLTGNPVLSADGSTLAYRDSAQKAYGSYLMKAGSVSAREICAGCNVRDFFSSPDSALVEYMPGLLVRQDLATGNRTELIGRGANRLLSSSLSRDDRWLALAMGKPDGRAAIYVAPVRDHPVPESEWVLILEDDHFLGSPRWSPSGKLLYYLSQGDGECAIWAQRLDPDTGRPLGGPVAVFRPHSTRYSLNMPAENGQIGIAPDRLIFYMAEANGNIYLATVNPRQAGH